MNKTISLEQLITFIRAHQGISNKKRITASSLLEKDLGITGDDGCELLEAIASEFNIFFDATDHHFREIFGLSENQYLFHSEGMSLLKWVASCFGLESENVKPITVGQLHLAICKAVKE